MSYQNRSEIPEKYKWNLGDIFASTADWEENFAYVSKEYKKLSDYQGKLGDRDTLLKFFKTFRQIGHCVGKAVLLRVYELQRRQSGRRQASSLRPCVRTYNRVRSYYGVCFSRNFRFARRAA